MSLRKYKRTIAHNRMKALGADRINCRMRTKEGIVGSRFSLMWRKFIDGGEFAAEAQDAQLGIVRRRRRGRKSKK